MEAKGIRLTLLGTLLLVVGFGCDKIDMRGMFRSYELVDERFDTSMARNALLGYINREYIEDTTQEYTVIAMGDSHIGGIVNFRRFMEEVKTNRPSAVVMVGDITTGRSEHYALFDEALGRRKRPGKYALIGNHDLYFNGWQEFKTRFGPSVYFFYVHNRYFKDLFICLDSGSGTLGKKQSEWLKKLLAEERGKYRHCVILSHVNLFRTRQTGSTNPMVEELQMLTELCVKHNVNMVVTGHDHKKSVEKLGPTTFIGLEALLDGHKNAGYAKLHFSASGIRHEFVTF
jgi:predicted phosphodiesterase